jgi:hypothetical protein
MNKFKPLISTLAMPLAAVVFVLLTGAGCGNKTVTLTSAQSNAFDSAPAEVKQTWQKALAADKANDYVTANNLLDSLKTMKLDDAQTTALQTEYTAFSQRLWDAAQKNNPAAVKAAQEINKSKSRR